jgi:hypothetical protein
MCVREECKYVMLPNRCVATPKEGMLAWHYSKCEITNGYIKKALYINNTINASVA